MLFALFGAAACGGPLEDEPAQPVGQLRSGLTQTITYVGKQSITDFTGYGQHLQYWPLFGLPSGQTARRTDDPNCIELTPDFANFKHHYLLPGRTFSNDALGNPIGTKTRGGYPTWATFKLPSGAVGRSGTFYDESNVNNSNNTVNELKIDSTTLSEFCLNLITDNTAGAHNPDVQLEARSDTVDLGLAGNPDFSFDGTPDMYTFRYTGMSHGDVIKIRFQCSSASGCLGAGLGGMMVSDISTCTPTDGGVIDAGVIDAGAADAGAADAGAVDAGAVDAGAVDAGAVDAGAVDAGAVDAGAWDGGDQSPGAQDAGGCGCQSRGATGAPAAMPMLIFLGWAAHRMRRRATLRWPARA